jgi:hypothetical protein
MHRSQNQIVEELLDFALLLAKKAMEADKAETSTQTSSSSADGTTAHRRDAEHGDTSALWIEFMNRLSVLQVLPVHTLNHRERVALFMNVYHCMILHSYMLLGSPSSITKWYVANERRTQMASIDVSRTRTGHLSSTPSRTKRLATCSASRSSSTVLSGQRWQNLRTSCRSS